MHWACPTVFKTWFNQTRHDFHEQGEKSFSQVRAVRFWFVTVILIHNRGSCWVIIYFLLVWVESSVLVDLITCFISFCYTVSNSKLNWTASVERFLTSFSLFKLDQFVESDVQMQKIINALQTHHLFLITCDVRKLILFFLW